MNHFLCSKLSKEAKKAFLLKVLQSKAGVIVKRDNLKDNSISICFGFWNWSDFEHTLHVGLSHSTLPFVPSCSFVLYSNKVKMAQATDRSKLLVKQRFNYSWVGRFWGGGGGGAVNKGVAQQRRNEEEIEDGNLEFAQTRRTKTSFKPQRASPQVLFRSLLVSPAP